MHITEEIHTAIVVAQRFNEQHINAQTAERALRNFYMGAGGWILSEDERKVLQNAVGILQTVIGKTGQTDVEKYLRNLESVKEPETV